MLDPALIQIGDELLIASTGVVGSVRGITRHPGTGEADFRLDAGTLEAYPGPDGWTWRWVADGVPVPLTPTDIVLNDRIVSATAGSGRVVAALVAVGLVVTCAGGLVSSASLPFIGLAGLIGYAVVNAPDELARAEVVSGAPFELTVDVPAGRAPAVALELSVFPGDPEEAAWELGGVVEIDGVRVPLSVRPGVPVAPALSPTWDTLLRTARHPYGQRLEGDVLVGAIPPQEAARAVAIRGWVDAAAVRHGPLAIVVSD